MDDQITFRQLGPPDAGEALTVQRAAFLAEGRAYGTFDIPPLTETLDEIVTAMSDGLAVGAFGGTRLVGSMRVTFDGSVGVIARVAVAPDQQGRGIGRRLVRTAMEQAPPAIAAFRLAAAAGSSGNLALYADLGFVEVERTVDVAGVDMVIMERDR